MNNPMPHEEDDQGEVFLDESDIIDEIAVDEEGPSIYLPPFVCICTLHMYAICFSVCGCNIYYWVLVQIFLMWMKKMMLLVW